MGTDSANAFRRGVEAPVDEPAAARAWQEKTQAEAAGRKTYIVLNVLLFSVSAIAWRMRRTMNRTVL